ncbi:sugar transferase [Stratiformator vulcanicus]|uniref:sugar transferase n=1 Tax=Stratiformator vulcanicus TaxID=2527980 RepID=UPI0028775462|nr:sugar transferase [Stratiformator vulcanicus]
MSRGNADWLHPASLFLNLANVERCRCERTGNSVSVIAFDSVDAPGQSFPREFVDHLHARVRQTDHVGILPDNRIAVLLWNSNREGAVTFVDQLQLDSASASLMNFDVFEHPYQPDSDVSDGDRSELSDKTAGLTRCLPLEAVFTKPLPAWKRLIDICGAAFGLVVLSPMLMAVALAIRFTSPGPIYFSQRRSGIGGRPFYMHKFRSMVPDAEALKTKLMEKNEQDGPAFKIEHDPRITPIGHFIRRTSIDELPQLWNVLRGEMSIVGPRPLPCSESDACKPWQKRRLQVTPGLTCIWQVQDRRNKIPFADWARMDIRYIRNRSLRQDLTLVYQTFAAVFGRKGV